MCVELEVGLEAVLHLLGCMNAVGEGGVCMWCLFLWLFEASLCPRISRALHPTPLNLKLLPPSCLPSPLPPTPSLREPSTRIPLSLSIPHPSRPPLTPGTLCLPLLIPHPSCPPPPPRVPA